MALGPTSARDKQDPFKQESVRFDVQAKTALERLRAATNVGAIVYDQAQSLTSPQQFQARNNLGLSSPTAAAQALGTVESGANYLDFYTATGQKWRIIQSAASKPNGGASSLAITYGFTFLTVPTVVISNGNGLAVADLILGAYSITASGFNIGSRNSGGTEVFDAYQVNYMALGRIA